VTRLQFRPARALALATLAASVVAVCTAGASSAKPADSSSTTLLRGTYTVGALAQLSGPTSWFGAVVRNATQLAIDDVNRNGGVRGRRYAVKFRDLQNDAAVSVAQFRQFMDVDKVPVVFLGSSIAALPTCPIAQRSKKTIIVNDGASSPLIPKNCGSKTFNTIPPSTAEMAALARFIYRKQGIRRVGIFRVNTDVNAGIASAFKTAWRGLGGQLVSEQSVEPGTADFRSQIAALRSASPAVTLLATEAQDASRFVRQAQNLGFRPQYVAQSNAINADVTQFTRDTGATIVYTTVAFNPAGSNQRQKAFIARYTRRFGATPVMLYAALAYDATRMVANAIKKGGYTAAGINRALRGLKSYTGVSGTVRYPKPGQPQRAVQLLLLKDGVAKPLAAGR
jgi:branched-chain amino acid transport system substrate-binding protein